MIKILLLMQMMVMAMTAIDVDKRKKGILLMKRLARLGRRGNQCPFPPDWSPPSPQQPALDFKPADLK